MYHVELRQFPHAHSRFNLTDRELVALIDPWVREKWVELGERKWNCNQAKLTILEGPQLAVEQLAIGRGWRTAQRESQDVTERVLAAATAAMVQAAQVPVTAAEATARAAASPGAAATSSVAPSVAALSDPLALGVQIAALLGDDPTGLLEAWRAAASSAPGLAPSESLALAEHRLRASGVDSG